MKKVLKWGGFALLFLIIGAALASNGENTDSSGERAAKATASDTRTSEATPEPTPEETPPPVREVPDPKGTYKINCDYVLGDFTDYSAQGFRFIAGGTLRNTGNVGIVTRVTVTWDQLGVAPLKQVKTVRVARGKTKSVQFTLLGNQDQIDLHQSADGNCRTKVKIIDTFGKPPFEDQ